tara:strand:+ start:117 stop:971 length:855 start_codon:yes stop_codon:yes gene_type:complete
MNNFKNVGYYERVNNIIDGLKLKNDYDTEIIKNRFLYEVLLYEEKRDKTKKYYNSFRFIVTLGSLFLPAILSIGQMDPSKLPKNFDTISYWSAWTISLTVTACNGFLQLFSLDKNYFTYSIVTEQLKTEGWQYLQLSGKYEDSPSHEAAFKSFCKSIENIKRKQIEQEFSGGKAGDKKKTFDFKKEMNNTLPIEYNNNKNKNENDDREVKDIDSKLELLNMMANKMGSSQNTNISSIEDFTKSLKDNAIDTINEKIEEKVNDVKETVIDVINETETPKINKDNP